MDNTPINIPRNNTQAVALIQRADSFRLWQPQRLQEADVALTQYFSGRLSSLLKHIPVIGVPAGQFLITARIQTFCKRNENAVSQLFSLPLIQTKAQFANAMRRINRIAQPAMTSALSLTNQLGNEVAIPHDNALDNATSQSQAEHIRFIARLSSCRDIPQLTQMLAQEAPLPIRSYELFMTARAATGSGIPMQLVIESALLTRLLTQIGDLPRPRAQELVNIVRKDVGARAVIANRDLVTVRMRDEEGVAVADQLPRFYLLGCSHEIADHVNEGQANLSLEERRVSYLQIRPTHIAFLKQWMKGTPLSQQDFPQIPALVKLLGNEAKRFIEQELIAMVSMDTVAELLEISMDCELQALQHRCMRCIQCSPSYTIGATSQALQTLYGRIQPIVSTYFHEIGFGLCAMGMAYAGYTIYSEQAGRWTNAILNTSIVYGTYYIIRELFFAEEHPTEEVGLTQAAAGPSPSLRQQATQVMSSLRDRCAPLIRGGTVTKLMGFVNRHYYSILAALGATVILDATVTTLIRRVWILNTASQGALAAIALLAVSKFMQRETA